MILMERIEDREIWGNENKSLSQEVKKIDTNFVLVDKTESMRRIFWSSTLRKKEAREKREKKDEDKKKIWRGRSLIVSHAVVTRIIYHEIVCQGRWLYGLHFISPSTMFKFATRLATSHMYIYRGWMVRESSPCSHPDASLNNVSMLFW